MEALQLCFFFFFLQLCFYLYWGISILFYWEKFSAIKHNVKVLYETKLLLPY